MDSAFLGVLNMSITGSYVILAVLLVRALLKRTPKKYSYVLWCVVLFRLVCPVSAGSVISLFNFRIFNMTTAQKGSEAALTYIPSNIAYVEAPKVTVGIPFINTAISERLPVATPAASVNPLQVWISLGAALWIAGMTALLLYSLMTYIRLEGNVATSVLLRNGIFQPDRHAKDDSEELSRRLGDGVFESDGWLREGACEPVIRLRNRVFECDRIRSPFILGFLRPRIYVPFGLGEKEQACVLRHEACHLQRKDHLVKLLGFVILALHWFNPLVWLAFTLMTKDMEMSCDEIVLSQAGSKIAKEYSATMLSFAVNERFPAANPLAFGETGIAERVKNVLRFRSPAKWVSAVASPLCLLLIAACAANPVKVAPPGEPAELYGTYAFEERVYMNPLSSYFVPEGYEEYYTLAEDSLTVTGPDGMPRGFPVTFAGKPVDENEFKSEFIMGESIDPGILGIPDISEYEERYQYVLGPAYPRSYSWRIYLMDDEIWLARATDRYMWSIFKIASFDGEAPSAFTQDELSYLVDTAYSLARDWYEDSYESGAAPGTIDRLDYRISFAGSSDSEVEVVFSLSDSQISVGVTFSRGSETNEWELLPVDALTVYDPERRAQGPGPSSTR